jgi:hypothetical protein
VGPGRGAERGGGPGRTEATRYGARDRGGDAGGACGRGDKEGDAACIKILSHRRGEGFGPLAALLIDLDHPHGFAVTRATGNPRDHRGFHHGGVGLIAGVGDEFSFSTLAAGLFACREHADER